MANQHLISILGSLTPVEVAVLKGIVSGDGDIGGRMASSHPDAKPPVSEEKKEFLEKLAKVVIEHKMSFPQIDKACRFAILNETTSD
jgi:hypothetical protein